MLDPYLPQAVGEAKRGVDFVQSTPGKNTGDWADLMSRFGVGGNHVYDDTRELCGWKAFSPTVFVVFFRSGKRRV